MIKAIIFDFDGTLSNRQDNVYYLYKYCFKKYFSDLNDYEYEAVLQDMMEYDCNGTIELRERMIQFRKKYPNRITDEDLNEISDYYYNNMYRYCKLKPEALDVVKALKGKYKLGLLTNGGSKIQHDKVNCFNLEELFDEVIVSGDVDVHKPDKKIYDMMAERLNVKNEECIYIGDTYSTDILGAIRANMIPIWFISDYEKPTSYNGLKISKLDELLVILKQLNS